MHDELLPVRERGLKPCSMRCRAQFLVSLPVRERGLKQFHEATIPIGKKSLPVRERGLKHGDEPCDAIEVKSLPVRERGLKLAPKEKVKVRIVDCRATIKVRLSVNQGETAPCAV